MIDRSCLQKREILQLNSICPVAAGTKEGYSNMFLGNLSSLGQGQGGH